MGDLVEGHDVGLDLALGIIAAVRAESERGGFLMSVCVADRAGNPVASARMDGALLGSYALERGVAVLLEKPIAGDVAGAETIAAAVARTEIGRAHV